MTTKEHTWQLWIDRGEGYKKEWESEPFEYIKYNWFERIIMAIKTHYS